MNYNPFRALPDWRRDKPDSGQFNGRRSAAFAVGGLARPTDLGALDLILSLYRIAESKERIWSADRAFVLDYQMVTQVSHRQKRTIASKLGTTRRAPAAAPRPDRGGRGQPAARS